MASKTNPANWDSRNPDYVPTGDTYYKHRRLCQEYVNNGGSKKLAYQTAFKVDKIRSSTIANLFNKNYIQGWIKDFEQEAFEVSTVTLGWAILKMKEVYAAAFKDKRYKEAIVAIDRIVAYSGKTPALTQNLDDPAKKPFMFVVPEKVAIGAPVATIENTKEAEERFNQEQIQEPPQTQDQGYEPTEQDAEEAFEKLNE